MIDKQTYKISYILFEDIDLKNQIEPLLRYFDHPQEGNKSVTPITSSFYNEMFHRQRASGNNYSLVMSSVVFKKKNH